MGLNSGWRFSTAEVSYTLAFQTLSSFSLKLRILSSPLNLPLPNHLPRLITTTGPLTYVSPSLPPFFPNPYPYRPNPPPLVCVCPHPLYEPSVGNILTPAVVCQQTPQQSGRGRAQTVTGVEEPRVKTSKQANTPLLLHHIPLIYPLMCPTTVYTSQGLIFLSFFFLFFFCL